jgi:signal transduction histidine kinase
VDGDADGLSQVLINLISNANEHTENGEITVTALSDGQAVTVTVTDNGEGIAPEALPGIFERRPRMGGSGEAGGIGFSICREIIKKHGGRIWVESEQGAGTSVSFTLPLTDRQTDSTGRKSHEQ